ncbi:MAG: hypothetical protein KDK54_22130 [Leptospiraceae bacterium]|nr:hypothetical protein [Leptospiraceae bacterium]
MKVLGIHDGHTSTACLIIDGEVRVAVSEERFTKVKGQGGFPYHSISYILETEKLNSSEIDKIALVGRIKPLESIKEYSGGRQKYFPILLKYYPLNPRNLIQSFLDFQSKKRLTHPKLNEGLNKFGFSKEKIQIIEHHQTHAATAYYLSHFYQNQQKVLVFTLDGSGDGLSGTVSIVDEDRNWKRLKSISSFDSLGILYSRTTQLLAMRPWEHEYKLMGMAPYTNIEYSEKVAKVFDSYLSLSSDGLGLENKTKLWGNSLLEQMYKDLRGYRFDSIAGGVQLFHEKITVNLIRNWIQKTGIHNIALAGGSFMNIKANKLVLDLPECDDLFVMPSCGDESCAIGAALEVYEKDKKDTHPKIQVLGNLYWGNEYSEKEILHTLEKYNSTLEYKKSSQIEKEAAELLASHKIIARSSGRMEWGARSLGNRAILANPSKSDNLRKLNIAIKMRDFWMPFAPSILWECRHEYAVIEKDIDACYMTLGFDSKEKAREDIIAALHPYDFTMRPQFVKKEHNSSYHKLISEFKKITGIGGVLNTSFNLHGMPIVNSPEDAIYTLLNSELDAVVIEDYLVWKK